MNLLQNAEAIAVGDVVYTVKTEQNKVKGAVIELAHISGIHHG